MPKPVTYVDMVFTWLGSEPPFEWRFEDCASPVVENAHVELASSTMDWYGTPFQVHWLDNAEACRICSVIFV